MKIYNRRGMKVRMQVLICILCGALLFIGVSACSSPNQPSEPEIGTLVLNDYNESTLPHMTHVGEVYAGVYTASDGIAIDVWLEIREHNGMIGSVQRLGVAIQGGTGSRVTSFLGDDAGRHSALLLINMRGSSITDMTADYECAPGSGMVSCLKSHAQFPKINPKLNAQDANGVLSLFAQDMPIMVDGQPMKPSELLPSDTVRSPVDIMTGSFGGVIVAYMLAENNRPALYNVFLEQITGPSERPISLGLDAGPRAFDILFRACETDTTCNTAYPDLRLNFVDFMYQYAAAPIVIDWSEIYASGVFDRTIHIIEEEQKVGKAIRYIGAIANAHGSGSTTITTEGYAPEGYRPQLGEQSQADYGIFRFDEDLPQWRTLLSSFGGFFPGLTNRTGMICSFGINRAANPDSIAYYNMEKAKKLKDFSGYGGLSGSNADLYTQEIFGYGFLNQYRQYLTLCPQLTAQTGGLVVPSVSNIPANNVIVYSGMLDVKHDVTDAQELAGYFQSERVHLINQTYLGQGQGEDSNCLRTIQDNLWGVTTQLTEGNMAQVLGDNCKESNALTASGLTGW